MTFVLQVKKIIPLASGPWISLRGKLTPCGTQKKYPHTLNYKPVRVKIFFLSDSNKKKTKRKLKKKGVGLFFFLFISRIDCQSIGPFWSDYGKSYNSYLNNSQKLLKCRTTYVITLKKMTSLFDWFYTSKWENSLWLRDFRHDLAEGLWHLFCSLSVILVMACYGLHLVTDYHILHFPRRILFLIW